MIARVLLADLVEDGAVLQPHEAVAIVQSLVERMAVPADIRPPFGPPCPDNIELRADGSVVCLGCAATPAVSELAILLDTLLPPGTPRVPGGLRYTIGRALLEVEARPFDSVAEFAASLNRFERGERTDVVRAFVVRALSGGRAEGPRLVASAKPRELVDDLRPADSPDGVRVERRRLGAERDQLRRELRALDAELYEREVRRLEDVTEVVPVRPARRAATWASWIGAGTAAAAAVLLLASIIYTRDPVTEHGAAARTATAAAAPVKEAAAAPDHPIEAVPLAETAATPDGSHESTVTTRPIADTTAPDNTTAATAGSIDDTGALVPSLDVHQRPIFSPSFASNGSAVFFHTGNNGDVSSALMAADTSGTELRVMTILDDGARNYHVQPSPDGKSIAFDSDRDGERAVYIADRDGSNVRRVSGEGYAAVPTWSPDGTELAFIRAEPGNAKVWNLWLLTLATGDSQRLTHYQYGQTWSGSWFPDGHRIAYAHENRLYVMELPTLRTRSFETPVAGRLIRTPAVSPDGTRIVFQVYRNGVWLLDLADGSMRCVLADPTAEEFAWAPDGHRVAFHSRRDGQWGIYVMGK